MGIDTDNMAENEITNQARVSGDNLKAAVNDIIVNYDDNGPLFAPPVIFIHGTPFNKSVWDLQAEILKSNYRVIMDKQPGAIPARYQLTC
jgi:hypothetical protein